MLEMALADPTCDPKCPYMFQYHGKRVRSIRTGFEKARHETGIDGSQQAAGKIIFHDTRRSAVTRMDALGIEREKCR